MREAISASLPPPANERGKTGDYSKKPHGKTCSDGELFRVYYKGLVSEETIGDAKIRFAGIGVAICDSSDSLVFESRKPLIGVEMKDDDFVGVKALIEGLNAAVAFRLRRIQIFLDNHSLNQYITVKLSREVKCVSLIKQMRLLQSKFASCRLSLEVKKDVKYAVELAREVIVSQANQVSQDVCGETLIETCEICFEDTYVVQMFCVNKCMHRYCVSCMSRHVEAELLKGKLPNCPYVGCKSKPEVESCKEILTPKLYDVMVQRAKEASIPTKQKIYCPYPSCSALMSETEVQKLALTLSISNQQAGIGKCVKCVRLFCIRCKVPWHEKLTCSSYKRLNPYPTAEDAKLKSLATRKHWRQCAKCSNMVELVAGCNHICCRCGCEFCYVCGAEWIDKNAACECPLWDEHSVLYDEQNRHNRPLLVESFSFCVLFVLLLFSTPILYILSI